MKRYINFIKWMINKIPIGDILEALLPCVWTLTAIWLVCESVVRKELYWKNMYWYAGAAMFLIQGVFYLVKYAWKKYNEEIEGSFNILKD